MAEKESARERLRRRVHAAPTGLSSGKQEEYVAALTALGYSRREAMDRLRAGHVTDADSPEEAIRKALAEFSPADLAAAADGDEPPTALAEAPADEPTEERPEPTAGAAALDAAINRATPAVEGLQDWLAGLSTPGGIGGLVLVLIVLLFVLVPVKGKDTRLSLLWKALMGQEVVPLDPKTPTYDIPAHLGQWAEQVGTDIVTGTVRKVPEIIPAVGQAVLSIPGAQPVPGLGAAPPGSAAILGAAERALSEAEQLLKDLGITP
ncbi:MAG TPA: RuvA C-terminal domain-containing protein [Solirubrobacteraceae bacterium]|nr:RuvA C-terminal domain-containing protein [Solirubrobacteraceae bacterium]